MTAYYNEIDPFAAQWLRNLIAAGLIAAGEVDERSIKDVRADDLAGFTRCHFFAGIAGWDLALQLAGWPADRPVWTGSCPCQPFSANGKRLGFADARHLWPEWSRLIKACRPSILFGEQSARAPEWLKLVRGDLEEMDYAMGCLPLEAASAGARHKRDRYYFVADADRRDFDWWDRALQMGRKRRAGETPQDAGARRIEWPAEPQPSTLAYGVPARMEQCCAFGNAIVPQVAAEFIAAYLECRP